MPGEVRRDPFFHVSTTVAWSGYLGALQDRLVHSRQGRRDSPLDTSQMGMVSVRIAQPTGRVDPPGAPRWHVLPHAHRASGDCDSRGRPGAVAGAAVARRGYEALYGANSLAEKANGFDDGRTVRTP